MFPCLPCFQPNYCYIQVIYTLGRNKQSVSDNSKAVLNIQMVSAKSYESFEDHYVPLDFSGWRYVELVEPESERFEQCAWPYGRCIYDIYRAGRRRARVTITAML